MCIQQPQDSSQRSAVIAHYNQSSWAHLSSPFGIKNGGKNTKPNLSLQQIPLQLSVLHKPLLGEQNERTGLCNRDFTERIRKHKDMVAGDGTHMRHGMHASAQPAPTGSAVAVHETLPKSQPKCLNTGSYAPHTGAGVGCRARAFPTMLGSQHLPWDPCQHPDLHLLLHRQEQSQNKQKQ